MLLSLETLLQLFLSSADISAAYFGSVKLQRDVYMSPQKSWRTHIDELWKLLNAAYGLIENGSLWELHVEECILSKCFTTIPSLPQFFILQKNGRSSLFSAKVVEDILIAGKREESSRFYAQISWKFNVRSYSKVQRNVDYTGQELLTITSTWQNTLITSIRSLFSAFVGNIREKSAKAMRSMNLSH